MYFKSNLTLQNQLVRYNLHLLIYSKLVWSLVDIGCGTKVECGIKFKLKL